MWRPYAAYQNLNEDKYVLMDFEIRECHSPSHLSFQTINVST